MKNTRARITLATLGLCLTIAIIGLYVTPVRLMAQTVYQLLANPLAQMSGSPGALFNQPTYAATMTIAPLSTANGAMNSYTQINGNSTTSSTCTVSTPTPSANPGQQWTIIFTASGSNTVTFTLSTPQFLPTATVAPTTGKSISVFFVSDGNTAWHEVARSASAQ